MYTILDIVTARGTHIKAVYQTRWCAGQSVYLYGEMTHTGFRSCYIDLEEEDPVAVLTAQANELEFELLKEAQSIKHSQTNKHPYSLGGYYKQRDKPEVTVYKGGGPRWKKGRVYQLIAVKKEGSFFLCLLQSPDEKNPTWCFGHELEPAEYIPPVSSKGQSTFAMFF